MQDARTSACCRIYSSIIYCLIRSSSFFGIALLRQCISLLRHSRLPYPAGSVSARQESRCRHMYPYLAPFLLATATMVLSIIPISSATLQFSIYCLSSFTTSSKSVISLLPLICHNPVMPGFMVILAL